ncbi:MAG: DUF1573 domain-containing protein [Phycisphaerales bacterium]|nr:DUF1573 domain-containing protein [Phycisphaerales bacterium]
MAQTLEPEEPAEQRPAEPAGSLVLVGKPVLTIGASEMDLGTILDVNKAQFKIDFTNTGDGVLVITRVQPSCGCTAATPNKTEYMPGEKGVIEGEFDPRGKEGIQSKTITIFTNDADHPSSVVTFKSNIEPLVKLEPKVLNFGKVDKAQGKSMFVTLTCGTPGFEATLATGSDDRFQASVVKTEEVEINGKKVRRSTVEVSVNKGARVGRGTSTIAVRTNEARADLVNIQVVAEVTGEFEITPSPTTLGNLPAGQPFEAKIVLKSRNGKPIKVKGVELRRPTNLGLETAVESNEYNTMHTVTIKGNAPQRSGAMQGELAVLTEEPGEEEVEIKFYGFVRLAGGQPLPPIPATQPQPTTTVR